MAVCYEIAFKAQVGIAIGQILLLRFLQAIILIQDGKAKSMTENTNSCPVEIREKKSIFDILPVRISIFLNAFIVLEWLSRHSIRGIWPDILVFCAMVAMSVFSWIYVWIKRKNLIHKWQLFAVQLPGNLITLLLLLMIPIPWLLLPFAFVASEVIGTKDLPSKRSPDRLYDLRVRYIPVGAYEGGQGRYSIVKTWVWFPVIERSVYHASKTDKDNTDTLFFSWVSEDTILVDETKERIAVD